MTNKFKQHIPSFVEVDSPPPTIEFDGLEMLLAIDVVSQWAKEMDGKKFSHFALSGNTLMAIYDNGYKWWAVGYIEQPDKLPLPQWEGDKKR